MRLNPSSKKKGKGGKKGRGIREGKVKEFSAGGFDVYLLLLKKKRGEKRGKEGKKEKGVTAGPRDRRLFRRRQEKGRGGGK